MKPAEAGCKVTASPRNESQRRRYAVLAETSPLSTERDQPNDPQQRPDNHDQATAQVGEARIQPQRPSAGSDRSPAAADHLPEMCSPGLRPLGCDEGNVLPVRARSDVRSWINPTATTRRDSGLSEHRRAKRGFGCFHIPLCAFSRSMKTCKDPRLAYLLMIARTNRAAKDFEPMSFGKKR